MHELGLAKEVLHCVLARATREGADRVVEVTLRIGRLNLVVPQSLSFYFDACKEGTLAAGAALQIEHVPGRARCELCRETFALDAPLGLCPQGHAALTWLSGFELNVVSMRIEDRKDMPCVEPAAATPPDRPDPRT